MQQDNNDEMSTGAKIGLGAVAIAALAGAYFLFGQKESDNRRKAKGWMLRVKADIVDQLEDVSDLTQEKYYEIIDQVSQKYRDTPNVDKDDLIDLVSDLKEHWNVMNEEMRQGKKDIEGRI